MCAVVVCMHTFNLFIHLEQSFSHRVKFNGHVIQFFVVMHVYWSHTNAKIDDISLEFSATK